MERVKTTFKNNKNIINNIIGAFMVRGFSLIIALFTIPVYLRYFRNQTVLGLWFTVLAVLNWVLMFDLGLGNGLRNKLPIALTEGDDRKVQQYISAAYISMGILILLLCTISFLIFPYIPWNNLFNIKKDIISHDTLVTSVRILFMGILVQFLLKLITSILYAIQKSAIANLLNLLSNIMILLFVIYIPNGTLDQSLIKMAWINIFCVNAPLLIATIIIFSTKLKKCRPSFKYYNNKYALEILKIGSVLLWLQIVFMIISSTNEFLISNLTNPSYVVEYQVYNKIFNTFGSLFSMTLVPIWSAVTKAHSENNYSWIKKLSSLLLRMAGVAFIVELSIIPFLQAFINVWLGSSKFDIKISYALIFAVSNSVFILHSVNTSLGNGMSFFKTQIIWMTFAAVVDFPLSYLFVHLTGGWIGVVLANVLAILPFEILEPIYFNKYINRLNILRKKIIRCDRMVSINLDNDNDGFKTESIN